MALTDERSQVVVKERKKGKFDLEVKGFNRETGEFSTETDAKVKEAYQVLDLDGPRNRGGLRKFLDKLTFHRPQLDGKLDSGEQKNAFAKHIGSEAAAGSPHRRIEMYKAMATILNNVNYNDKEQVSRLGQILSKDSFRDPRIIGATISKMDNPEQIAKLLHAMGKDKHGNFRGTSVLAYALEGRNYSQEPDKAKDNPERVSAEKQIENKQFIQKVLRAMSEELNSPQEMAKFVDLSHGKGNWQVAKKHTFTATAFQDAVTEVRAELNIPADSKKNV